MDETDAASTAKAPQAAGQDAAPTPAEPPATPPPGRDARDPSLDQTLDTPAFFPSLEHATIMASQLMSSLEMYLRVCGYPADLQLVVRQRDVADIAIRVLKRDEYYRYFHGLEISEAKRAALQAYWVAKLRPFTISDRRFLDNSEAEEVNERFAAYILLCASCVAMDEEEIAQAQFTTDYFQKLVYSFRYRNLGIDEFVLLAEGITAESFQQVFSKAPAGRAEGDA